MEQLYSGYYCYNNGNSHNDGSQAFLGTSYKLSNSYNFNSPFKSIIPLSFESSQFVPQTQPWNQFNNVLPSSNYYSQPIPSRPTRESSVYMTEDKRMYDARSGAQKRFRRTPSWRPHRSRGRNYDRHGNRVRTSARWPQVHSRFSRSRSRKISRPRHPRSHSSDTSIGSSSYSHSVDTPADSLQRYCKSHLCTRSCSPVKSDSTHHMVIENNKSITDRYVIMGQVGEGTFGRVVHCFDSATQENVAIKVVKNVAKYREAARLEIRVLDFIKRARSRSSDLCINALNWFNFHGHICIVFELLGPSVFEFMKANDFYPFSLEQTRHIAFQLVSAVEFLHHHGITHTDLKPENILFVSGRSRPHESKTTHKVVEILHSTDIKIIDFGSATFKREHHTKIVQTRHYRAPEVILELGWSEPCDVWSVGCIIFEIYSGKTLFMTHDNIEHLVMIEKVLQCRIPSHMTRRTSKQKYFRLGGLHWNNASDDGRYIRKNVHSLSYYQRSEEKTHSKFFEVIAKMLIIDPKARITMREARRSSFFNEYNE